MFDNLKESLGRFREDVEEQAEVEDVEEQAEVEDVEEQAEAVDDVRADDAVDGADGDAVDGADGDAVDGRDAGAGGGAGGDVREGRDAGGGADAADGSDGDATGGDDAPRDAGAERGPGLTSRARSLAAGKVYIDEADLEGPLWELELALLENDVAMPVAEEILEKLREDLVGERRGVTTRTGSVVEDALFDALLGVLSIGQFDFAERIAEVVETDPPAVVIFTGVNGVGKTTTIAKVARYLDERGYSSVLANGDTFRAGASEQIEGHAERLDAPLIGHDRGGDPAAVLYDAVEYAQANDVDVVLGDTAGRLHTSDDLMAQLAKIDRVVDPDLTLFVDEAVAGQDAVERARTFDEAAEIDGTVLTKADADASGGAAISIARVTGKPILFLGVGQGYDDLERFDPEAMVARLLGVG